MDRCLQASRSSFTVACAAVGSVLAERPTQGNANRKPTVVEKQAPSLEIPPRRRF